MSVINKRSYRKISILLFIVSILILPVLFNSLQTNSIITKSTNKDNLDGDLTEEQSLFTSLSSLPNADDFSYYKAITIDHNKVNGSSDLVNFPVLISLIDSDLDDKAQYDGDDIAFANSTAWLDHEIELYNPNYAVDQAQLIAWVRIPLLSTSSDTRIFMFYGDPDFFGSHENPTGVWDSNYEGVWHLKEDPGFSGIMRDSTINGNDGTAMSMGSGDQAPGQIDGSLDFEDDDYVSIGYVGPEIKTIEFWMRPDSLGSFDYYNTGYRSPTNYDTVGPHNDWTNPAGAYANDGNRATESTNYEDQDWYDFGFSIPGGVNIDGILVSIDASTSVQFQSTGCRVRLSGTGGSNYTSYKSQSWSSTYDSYRTVGGSSDTWGRSWSPSDFTNANFRVWLEKTGSYSTALRVDHIQIIVYYSTSSDSAVIDLDGTDSIQIDYTTGELKPISFPGVTTRYIDGDLGSFVSTGQWFHVAITDTTGLTVSALDIARTGSYYFDGGIDELRLSNVIRSADWIATEYNNQKFPFSFYSVGVEGSPITDIQVNAIDSYGNPIPYVNISIYENDKLIRSDIAGTDGTVNFNDFLSLDDKFNFTVSMTSNIQPYHTVTVNRTSEAILIGGATQIINLICDVSTNIFNLVDADGKTLDSGWIIVGNTTDTITNCTIDNAGHAIFRWLNMIPYQYNYTVWYHDPNYNPKEIKVASGNIISPNSDVDVTVALTTVNFTVVTQDESQFVSGVKLKLNNSNTGENVVNFITGLDGKATFRWVNSSGINSNYTLTTDFYGESWQFEIDNLTTGLVFQVDFEIKTQTSYTVKIPIGSTELEEFETQLISLNPTNTIIAEIGVKLKLRALFNVTSVPTGYGYEDLLGPSYADSMWYQILEGFSVIRTGMMSIEENLIGRHQIEIETDGLEINQIYIIEIRAQKYGYVLPTEISMSLFLIESELLLNQSRDDDSPQSIYWQESVNMSVKPYGRISESFNMEQEIYEVISGTTFKFSIPDISSGWNLSQITFNFYNISWNALPDDINITIEMIDYGIFKTFNTSNHNGYNYAMGSWTGIGLYLDRSSLTGDNNFDFTFGGTFEGTLDVIADAIFVRDKINSQYSKFNITDAITILSAEQGWGIKNITFELYNCYNASNWALVDPLNDVNLNFSTNEGIKYQLDSGSLGYGEINIDDRIIYPLEHKFLFTIESYPEIMFDVNIKVEYLQVFYQNRHLETLNITKIVKDNDGSFSISVEKNDWNQEDVTLFISGITDGIDYFLPSLLGMTITVGGQTYSISDINPGEGMFSLEGLNKDTIYTAVINTNQPVIYNLTFISEYSRTEIYNTKGSVSYSIIESPSIFGTVLYNEEKECYIQMINSTILNAGEYTVRFSVFKDNYVTTTKDLDLIVLNRLTLLNGSSGFFRKIENIYVQDADNFTFFYTDAEKGTILTNLGSHSYIWEKYDGEGNVIESGEGDLIPHINGSYILDFNTKNKTIGEYLIIATMGKENYEFKNAMISLTIEKRYFNYLIKYENQTISNNQINIQQGKTITIELILTDPTKKNAPLTNTTVKAIIGGVEYTFKEYANGIYRLDFIADVNTFFSSKTLTGIINISKVNYHSQEFTITLVVEMHQLIPGIPTFYFILVLSAIVVFVGSTVGYRAYKNAKIPNFVKKVRAIKKAIDGHKDISESLLYRDKEVFIGEKVKSKWDQINLSLESIFGIELEKKAMKAKKKISETVKRREIKPLGLLLMKWDMKIGTEILGKYPEDTALSEKTLMQIYSTHEYSGEKGVITLSAGLSNVLSYYAGPDTGYYLILVLKPEDEADYYEGGMANILRILLEHIEDDSYLTLMPSLFQRISLYPSLSEEEIYAITYQDEIKRMIIENLRKVGVMTRSELMIWLRDMYHEGFVDLDAILLELVKRDIIKQVSVKGLESEIIVLTNDFFMLRVPPVKLVKDSVNYGLPSQFKEQYLEDIEKFFQNYRPSSEDNLRILENITNPETYEILRLLRTAIVTRQDLEKLRTKGVEDVYGSLKILWDNQLIRVFRDDNDNEYYALLSDFYIDLIFPKYLLKVIKSAYEQKSIATKALTEYLRVLEESYYDLKARADIKEKN